MIKISLSLFYKTIGWLVGIIVVILLLAALAIQFIIFPNINQYKERIAKVASDVAQKKIVIGNIKADWQEMLPHLSLTDITIFDAQNRPALQLKDTEISFSWLSVPSLEPKLANLVLRNPELTIRRDSSGQIYVAGIAMQGPSKPELPNWLLRQNRFAVLNAKVIWIDELRKAPALSLNQLNLQIISPPWKRLLKNHQIRFSALPSVGSSEPINLNADIHGNDISQFAEWHGSVDLQLNNTNIAAFKPWLDYNQFTQPIVLQAGTGKTAIHLKFAQHHIQSIDSNVTLNDVQLQLKANAPPVILNKLAGEIHWKNSNTHQSVSVNHLVLNTSNGLYIENATGSYTKNKQQEEQLHVKIPDINLALSQPYLLQLPLPSAIMQKITQISPKGKLNELALDWTGKESNTTSYQFSSKFNGLSIQAHEKIPGFENLTGVIEANEKRGKITLQTQKAKLDFKDILRWPIPIDYLNGDITWQIDAKGILIAAKKINMSNPHLAGGLEATYLMDGNKGGLLNLNGKFGHGNAKFAPFYYPIMLGPATLHWLDTSILSGRAEDINMTIKGRLADFPYVDSKNNLDQQLGLFRVTARVNDSELEYGIGWPNIQGLGINLLFEGKRMELNADKGHIFGNKIIKSKTTIPQLDADSPILNIVSELTGPVPDGIKFVNKSPVREVAQGFTDDLVTGGQGKLALTLRIPMHHLEEAKYTGAYQIFNGSMASASIPTITGINGLLEFTENSLSVKNINAIAYGAPLTFSINSNKDKSVHVTAKGKINDAGIKQLLLEHIPNNPSITNITRYLSGSTNWNADVTVLKPNVNIEVHSDLMGLGISLPAPFNKLAKDSLTFNLNNKEDKTSNTLAIDLGNRFTAKISSVLENDKLKFNSGMLRFNLDGASNAKVANATTNPLTDTKMTKGLQILGSVDYLDIDAWRNVLQEFTDSKSKGVNLPIQKVSLKINTLDAFGRRLNQLKISNNSNKEAFSKEGFSANVQSREVTGDLQWSTLNNGKLTARLSNLTIPEAAPNSVKPAPEESTRGRIYNKLEQDYPALDIIANNFEFNHKKFGGLELIAYPQSDNWIIQKLKLNTAASTINAEGVWNNWVRSPNTFLNITWDINNLGNLLKDLGYPGNIKDGEGVLSGQLHWPGSPHEFKAVELNGELKLGIKKGQVLKVEPGVGRLLGLLSLQSLPRRLALDFRDLFSNGFAFDKINGTVKINRGIMRSDNFEMAGPAADVTMKGEINLQKESQHLYIKVLPRVSDSLSLAALTGGPLAGAVAFLAQKILKDPLNKIASSEYEIIGTWDNPQEIKETKNRPLKAQ